MEFKTLEVNISFPEPVLIQKMIYYTTIFIIGPFYLIDSMVYTIVAESYIKYKKHKYLNTIYKFNNNCNPELLKEAITEIVKRQSHIQRYSTSRSLHYIGIFSLILLSCMELDIDTFAIYLSVGSLVRNYYIDIVDTVDNLKRTRKFLDEVHKFVLCTGLNPTKEEIRGYADFFGTEATILFGNDSGAAYRCYVEYYISKYILKQKNSKPSS